jgi:type I restriction enzyme S subunit
LRAPAAQVPIPVAKDRGQSWPIVRLGDLLQIKHGFAFKGEFFEGAGDQLVLTPGNFKIGGGLQVRNGKERYYSDIFPSEFALDPGDLLIAMTDLTQGAPILGSPVVIPPDGRFLHNQRLGKIVRLDESRLDPTYAYYLFVWDGVRAQLRATATGATVRHTAPRRIYSVEVALPPLPIQRKIAVVLSAYDDLIENNERRIKILEEMAQRIYREWFVDFRYPGHESVPLVESELGPVPEGWTVRPLGEMVHDVRDSIKAGPVTAARPYVPIDCINARSLALVDWKPGLEAASSLLTFNRGDILFGAMRPYFHKVALAPWTGTTRTTCFVLRVPRASDYSFAVMTLFDDRTIEYATSHSSGTTIPYARWKGSLATKLVAVPDARAMARFDAAIQPIMHLLTDAGARLGNLRETYDLLLPRLVSGEINVADLNIPAPELAV